MYDESKLDLNGCFELDMHSLCIFCKLNLIITTKTLSIKCLCLQDEVSLFYETFNTMYMA